MYYLGVYAPNHPWAQAALDLIASQRAMNCEMNAELHAIRGMYAEVAARCDEAEAQLASRTRDLQDALHLLAACRLGAKENV
jgi:hypothetical protein